MRVFAPNGTKELLRFVQQNGTVCTDVLLDPSLAQHKEPAAKQSHQSSNLSMQQACVAILARSRQHLLASNPLHKDFEVSSFGWTHQSQEGRKQRPVLVCPYLEKSHVCMHPVAIASERVSNTSKHDESVTCLAPDPMGCVASNPDGASRQAGPRVCGPIECGSALAGLCRSAYKLRPQLQQTTIPSPRRETYVCVGPVVPEAGSGRLPTVCRPA